MDYYWLKAFHIIAFTVWMAGMFYLPRLFAYHASAPLGSESATLLAVMERNLLRLVMNPAMIITFGFGIWLAMMTDAFSQPWMHVKMTLVLLLAGFHGGCAVWRKQLAGGTCTRSARFFRMVNLLPIIVFIGIVLLAIVGKLSWF